MNATICIVIIIGLYATICIAEAWLEETVISLKDPELPNYAELNKKEHFRSAVYALLLSVPFFLIANFYQLYWLNLAIAINRRLFFDFGLKLFRRRILSLYEGNGPWDSFFKKTFGKWGAWKELVLEIILVVVSVTLTLLFNEPKPLL